MAHQMTTGMFKMHKPMEHHHHEFGSPACRQKHDVAAPEAFHEMIGERTEGE